ncbi:hypothetical protein R1sor_024006 [Riccia sorocarpa]|uniref:Uncharacterized protein n=1 Tax=Riccia sorocarpa TaxID=122646 RepID=A0ABD3GSG8_9MARC
MTRPPRAKYPSDGKNYHEAQRPEYTHTIRLPEELLDMYVALKNSLGPRKSHADVVRFLFEAAEPTITAVLQFQEQRPVPENEDVRPSGEAMVDDPDGDVQDPDDDVVELGLLSSDDETLPTGMYAANSDDEQEVVLCPDSHAQIPEAGGATVVSRQCPLKYPELATHDLAYKLKSWIYTCCKNATRGDTTPQLVTKDIHNAADHWAGDHSVCRTLPSNSQMRYRKLGARKRTKISLQRESHKAVKDFIKKYRTVTRTNKDLVTRTTVWKYNITRKTFG